MSTEIAGTSAETKTENAAPYTKVLLNIRINHTRASEFGLLGLSAAVRNDEKIIEKHKQEAEEQGLDPFRGKRVDATGRLRSDSGRPVFGWDRNGRNNVSFARIKQDLTSLGYLLISVNLAKRKPNPKTGQEDNMYSLYLSFEKGQASQLKPGVELEVDKILNRTYEHVHAFRNPDGTATINPSHAITPVRGQEIAHLRITQDGSFLCIPATVK